SHKERLCQIDLISVIISIGTLLTVLVVFFMLFFWDDAIEAKNDKDLKALAHNIDTSFTKKIETYRHWLDNDALFKEKVKLYNKKVRDTAKEAFKIKYYFGLIPKEKSTGNSHFTYNN